MRKVAVLSALLLACAAAAQAYPVGPAISLEKLSEEADLVFKGTAVASSPVKDDWFQPYADFVAVQTQFKLVSLIKGDETAERLMFRHYDESPNQTGRMFEPQHYHFVPGKTYIVFAKKIGPPGFYRQVWMYHKLKEDQGVLLCPNDKPVVGATVKDILWHELTAMLAGRDAANVLYAIRQIDQMSGGPHSFEDLADFDRKDVLMAVRRLMTDRDAKIAQAAILLVGSHNPYMTDERVLYWLATVGSGNIPGLATMDPKMKNLGGQLYWKYLVAVADGNAPGETRAMAILALGLVREQSLAKPINRWLTDSTPAVRAAAAVLLADFPGPGSRKRLATVAADPSPEVRACVAHAIGFSQQAELADVLGKLLADREFKVRQAAAMSLLSFSPKNAAIAAVFKVNLASKEFQPLFLIALAREKPADYLDLLVKAIKERTGPKDFWGGELPAFTAWQILFRYLQSQSEEEIRSGRFNRCLDALERVGDYSSSEPRDLYAFYLQRGMTERAAKFRRAMKKVASYDIDYYFKQVDENPAQYKRE
jgi:hypothetical protein